MNRKRRVAEARKAAKEAIRASTMVELGGRTISVKQYREEVFPKPTSIYFGDFEKNAKVLEDVLLKYCVTSGILAPEQIPARIQEGKQALLKRIAKFYNVKLKGNTNETN